MLGVDFGGFWGVFMWFFEAFLKVCRGGFSMEISREFARPKTSGYLQEDSKILGNMGIRWGLLRYSYVVFMLFLR